MATGKLSPRQKMINMMYLVLMALLALNVSREILKSFHLMEVSFNRAKENLDGKIQSQLTAFEKQVANDATLKPYYNRALEAQKITDEFVHYVEEIKDELTEKTGGRMESDEGTLKSYENELVGNDNIEVHANYFMVDDAEGTREPGYKGHELEEKVNSTREKLLNLLKSDDNVKLEPGEYQSVAESCQLKAELTEKEREEYKTWSEKYLENTPLAGVVTMLTKMQSDAKATQGAVMDVLNRGEAPPTVVTGLTPMVKPVNGSMIMQGGTYEAEIFLAAQTRGSENDEYVLESGEGSLEKRGDKWYYKADGSQSGTHKFDGVVKVKSPKGEKTYGFNSEFQVFQSAATISAVKMNALYIDVDNDISVGVPGVKPADVQVTMTGGTITRKGDQYVARCTNPGEAVINVSARLTDGTVRNVGSSKFRVKRLPNPKALWGTIGTGRAVPKQVLMTHSALRATMGEEFLLDGIKYQVLSYSFVLIKRRDQAVMVQSNNAQLTGRVKGAIKNSNPGDRIIVDKIRAKGPSGIKTLDPILIEII